MSMATKSRSGASKSFQSPSRTGFGSFGGFATTSSSLSYISEPPDFSAISDANVVVSLKNLLKKDSTTKAKALDDLLLYVQAHPYEKDGGVEEPVLDAWIKLYARTCIDNARRVRELSHIVQFELMKSARKRMEKRIAKVAAPWLAGTYDKDRVVSRAATDGLSSFLNTDEKVTQFWRRLQGRILEHALESIRETPDTLSDERSTTKEDAEAKYYRVVGAALSLVLSLLQKVGVDQTQQQLDQFLGTDAVWAMAAAEDPFVRRMVYQLAQTCLQEHRDLLKSHLPKLGRALVSDALKTKQTGSALDYVRVLTALTTLHPEIWGTKKHPLSRLQPFVERGSQGSSSAFWQELRQLILAFSLETVSPDTASGFMKALRAGISSREEPRANAPYAWACYFETLLAFLAKLTPEQSRLDFIKDHFYPVTQQYLYPVAEKSSWNSGAPLSLLPKPWVTVSSYTSDDLRRSTEQEWRRLAETFLARMSNSLPEVSKDFRASQQSIADEGERWFTLVEAIAGYNTGESDQQPTTGLADPFLKASTEVLQGALQLLTRRNFKPFGAAAVIASASKRFPALLQVNEPPVVEELFPTDRPDDLKNMLASPSAPYILSCLNVIGSMAEHSDRYCAIWTSLIDVLLQGSEGYVTDRVAMLISSQKASSLAQNHRSLQEFLISSCLDTANGKSDAWDLFDAALTYGAFTNPSIERLATDIVQRVGKPTESNATALRGLELILHRRQSLFSGDSDLHVQLVTNLLALTEISDDTVSALATKLCSMLDRHGEGVPSLVGIIQENLDSAGQTSLEINTLVEQAKAMLVAHTATEEQLFPNTNFWMEELSLFLQEGPDPSLSLTSSLGGAYYLVRVNPATTRPKPRRDRQGMSIPARIALYTTKLIASGSRLLSLPQKFQTEVLYLLCLVVELVEDQLVSTHLPQNSRLWTQRGVGSEYGEVEDFTASARKIISDVISSADHWKDGEIIEGGLLGDLIAIMLQQANGLSPLALYSAKALTGIFQSFAEARGLLPSAEERLTEQDVLKAKPDTVFASMAILTGFGETLAASKSAKYLCNHLVSDVAGAKPAAQSTLSTMVLLNACLSVYESGELPVENRRQVFAVRQITSWTESPSDLDSSLVAESCKALNRLCAGIGSVYGPYWEQAIKLCIFLWNGAGEGAVTSSLPCIHASLKLAATLESMEGANDDLDDALATHAEARSLALIHLLKSRGDVSNQPFEIVDALLCRRVAKIPLQHVKDLSELYGLVASESREIQTAAFDLLNRAIAAAQSQISIDVLLEKRDAKLPDELLSLLLDAPTLEAYPDDLLATFPGPIRSYLLSWRLVFDAFGAASAKVRTDYAENLKASSSLEPLMNFTFDVLGHSAAHPLNLDKEGFNADHIRGYDIKTADAEPDERNMQWLLIHLFYLALKYVPGLFKAWFLDCRSKQTKVAVESWMTKYFSPIIISENLDEVAEWAAKQEAPEEDEKELMVKVSRAAREVVAGYEVDELQASISIRIPPGYPLESVNVVGINRVAVSERKWQNWLMITQGVITFSNGSIVDGLATFRRNVVGALKGQTECAICYSIISSDKKMPDKRCGTCKNAFHRTCLYKWFQTSHQNTCPLCRNPIDYLGSR